MSTQKIVRYAFLLAVAVLVNYIESFVNLATAVPGVKLGLANAVGILVLYYLGDGYYAGFGVLRVLLSALLWTGFGQAFFIAMGGTIVATAITLLLKHSRICSIYGISVGGAVFHGIGQIAVVCIIYETIYMFTYMIITTISGVLTGILVAYIASLIIKRLPQTLIKK